MGVRLLRLAMLLLSHTSAVGNAVLLRSSLPMPCGTERRATSRGFTLVELLVVIAIVGALVALLLPAVQSAREAARLTQCTSHIKQISLGLQSHHDTHGHFPYGGWGSFWAGVPGRGSGLHQPGGWIYSVLPEVEQEDLHQLGLGATGEEAHRLYSQRLQTPVPLFNCPTRRRPDTWPSIEPWAFSRTPFPYGEAITRARSDYAINGGAVLKAGPAGPESTDESEIAKYWSQFGTDNRKWGVSDWRWGAKISQITDGTSNTYLIGEKYVNVDQYYDGSCKGDNESMYNGYGYDVHRFTGGLTGGNPKLAGFVPPWPDTNHPFYEGTGHYHFGSAHPAGAVMSKCDGSAAVVPFDVDGMVFLRGGHRCDDGVMWEKKDY